MSQLNIQAKMNETQILALLCAHIIQLMVGFFQPLEKAHPEKVIVALR
jgi:hypothetical protein